MPILREHDKFYTCDATARACLQKVLTLPIAHVPNVLFLEPSAGTGAFYELLPPERRLGLDIEPAHPEVTCADFLAYELPEPLRQRTVITVGNPPFGRNSSLAKKFVNRAAEMSDVVAFILPRTFQKRHMQRRVHPNMHLVAEYEVPDNSFIYEGREWDVPCVFQIWEKRAEPREDGDPTRTHPDFLFVKPAEADFAIRRVGRSAGKVFRDFAGYARNNHHFIRAENPEAVIRVLDAIDWTVLRKMTAGMPCIGKEELIRQYAIELARLKESRQG